MADSEANIRIDIDTASALASIKNLQRQISAFHTQMQASGNAANAALSRNMQKSLVDSINATGKFSANLSTIKSTTESFTTALERNKLSMGEYFRYAGASTKTFGRLFASEFQTIDKVARERVKTLQTQYIKMGRDANGALQAIKVRPIALDMQNLGTQTAMAAQKQALFNQLIKQGSTNLLNWGKNTQWAGRQLMVGFTIPLAMLGSVATKSFMEIEKQAVRFKRVYGELFTTGLETEQAFKDVRKLADEFTKYGVAVSKTLELAADLAATGKMGADLTAQVAEATRLAVLGGVEQSEALKATISLTDAFGVSAEGLAKKIDFLNAVENQTVTSIEDLTVAIPKAGPVVQQLGGDVEDLTFFLTAMREGGINASEGANALKSGLASMINPTGKASEMLEGFGINLKGIVDANKGNVKNIVIDFAKALDTLDPLNRAQAIEQLFGKFQFARLSTLFQNVIKEGNQASRVLSLTNATTAELAILSERELKKIEESPAFKFQKSIEDLKVSLAPIGVEFVKLVTPIIEFGTKLLKQFNEMGDGGKQFVTGLIAVLGLLAPAALMTVGLIANGIANLAKGFNSVRLFYQKLSGSSSQLASQTQYLTSEQLEAAAVAASLDQSHARLRQTFTSETAALQQLIATYQAATRAQLAMNAAAAGQRISVAPPITRVAGGRRAQSPQGPIDGVPGYARGVVSVPGPKGAGDVVPAMLSPGEAVIPAKQSRKYRGIISSLISDNVPGFRFGLNPFASMLGRSNVAVRMGSQNFISALQNQGKNARYQNAFQTQTGADYIRESGSQTTRQRDLRSAMERDVFGLDPKTTSAASRPTYGYAKTSILQSLLNRAFGTKGKNFNSTSVNPGDSLSRYGDIDLITKGSVAKRSSAFPGDALVNYNWATQAGTSRRIPDLNRIIENTGIRPAPMRGASPEQLKGFERLGSPFGSNKVPGTKSEYWTNPKPAYTETYTPGGFGFKEIDKIIARDPAIARKLKQELKAAGLGGVKVQGSGFIARLFKQLGVPGYMSGTLSVPNGDSLDSLLIKARKSISSESIAGRVDAGFVSQAEKYLLATDGVRRTIPRSLEIMEAVSPGSGVALLKQIQLAGVSEIDAMKQMSMGADFSDPANPQKLKTYVDKVREQLSSAEKKKSDGSIKSNSKLTRAIRSATGWTANNEGARQLAHIGGGTKITAKELLDLNKEGKFKLRKEQIALLEGIDQSRMISVKTALGMDGFSQRVNAAMNGNGASKSAFLKDFDVLGANKWNSSIRFAGGNPEDFADEARRFDPALRKVFADLPEGTLIVDSEDQVRNLAQDGRSRVSVERIYAETRSKLSGVASRLIKTLDNAQILPAEARSRDKDLEKEFRSPGKKRAVSGPAMPQLVSAAERERALLPRIPIGFGPRRAFSAATTLRAANGVVSVPGPKGAGDVVPAMLSPGEAVIPAKMSKKYAPLISSMISDGIPGYEDGYNPEKDVFRTPPTSRIAPPSGPDSSGGFSFIPEEKRIGKLGDKFGENFLNKIKGGAKDFGGKMMDGAANASKTAATKVGTKLQVAALKAMGAGLGGYVPLKDGSIYDQTTGQTFKNKAEFDAAQQSSRPRTAADRARAISAEAQAKNGKPSVLSPVATAASRMQANRATRMEQQAAKAGMSRDELKSANKEKFQRFGGRMMGVGMVGSTAAMMAGMLPGEAGKTAQEMALPIMALSSMAMFIQGPVSGAIVALGAAIGGILFVQSKLNEAYKSGADEAIKLRTAIGGSTEAIRSMSEFAGTVTAGEVADRRRQDKFQLIPIAAGKTTFGESFVQGEQGQALLENLKKDVAISGGNTSSAYKQMAQQLKMSVISGALTEDQAGSIAAQLGAQLGDASFGIKVRAEIQQLIGPNGENITKDPLSIATKIGEESMAQMSTSLTAMQENLKVMGPLATQAGRDWVSGGIIAGSSIGGAAIGAAIGTVVPVIGTAIGAIVGGIAGAIGGVVSTIATMEEQAKKAGALAGAYVADMTIALQNQTEIMDVLDQYYSKKMLEAEAEGDITEYKRLQVEYDQKKNDLAAKAAEISKSVVATLDAPETDQATREAIMTGLKNAAATKYKDDPNFALYQPLIDKNLADAVNSKQLTVGQEGLLRQQMLTGDLPPAALSSLLTTAQTTGQMGVVVDIVANLGGDTAGEMNSILNMIKDPKLKADLILNIKKAGTNEAEANKALELALDVQALGGVLGLSVDTILSYIINNPEEKKIMDDIIDKLNSTEVNTVEQAYEIVPEFSVDGKWADAFNEEYFSQLKTNAEKETYLQAGRIIMAMPEGQFMASTDFKTWLGEDGARLVSQYGDPTAAPTPGMTPSMWQQAYADSEAQRFANTGTAISGTVPAVKPPTKSGGAGGPQGSWLDDVVKQTRDVSKATISLTEGFEKSLKAIRKFSKIGVNSLKGLSGQLRNAGAPEEMVSGLLGLNEKDFDKQYSKLFRKTKKGNVVLTEAGKDVRKRILRNAAAEFTDNNRATVKDLDNQNKAVRRLITSGMSLSDAYAAVEDATLAAAIAGKQITDKELKGMIANAKLAEDAIKQFRDAATVQESITETNKLVAATNALSKTKYSFAEQQAILSDSTLTDMFMSGKNEKLLKARIKQILTPEFLQGLFDQGFNAAMDAISAKERKIELDFEVKNQPDIKIIDAAQNDIAKISFVIDDLQDGIRQIADKEEIVNKKYEDRNKALNDIKDLNADVVNQQKAQLTIADALSRGDIAAAAKAAQELRETQAQSSIASQQKALELAREKELAMLTSSNGKTRKQLEDEIKKLQNDIFAIEESRLEPAQERVRLADVEKQALIDSVSVLDKTRLEWEKVASGIELAKIGSTRYTDQITAALGQVEALKTAWTNATPGEISVDVPQTDPIDTLTPDEKKAEEKKTEEKKVESKGSKGSKGVVTPKPAEPTGPTKKDQADALKRQLADAEKLLGQYKSSLSGISSGITTAGDRLGKAKTALSRVPSGSSTWNTSAKVTAEAELKSAQAAYDKLVSDRNSISGKANKLQININSLKSQIKSLGFNSGGYVAQKFAEGGLSGVKFAQRGTDTIPAMLTPGEFVMRKYAVENFGLDKMKAINSGTYSGESVYNYSVNVNVQTDANADQIARNVMTQIKRIDSQRIRGNKF
jgi:hypothetical protein